MRNANTKFAKTNSLRGRGGSQHGLTLVEILIVIAISVLLFLLLLRPLTESFKLTQQAQALVAAQDSARKTLEQLTRELGSAVFVFDNASHPFNGTNDSPTALNDRYTNFLNFNIPTSAAGTYAVAHAYNCKIDMVMAAHKDTGGLVDPTTHEPISLSPSGTGSASITSTSLIFPLAPGTTVVRDFVGLKNPARDYSNANENLVNSQSDPANTYVLYRAQFSPYNSAGTPTNADGTHLNEELFVPQHDATGAVMNAPETDDPDFFRYVKVGDTNWLTPGHAAYTAGPATTPGTAAAHNVLVDNWVKIAKAIITAPEVDLLLLPRNTDHSIAFDGSTDPFPGIAHFGIAHDIVTGTDYPIVNSSVTFRPATISSDATPSTTVDYASIGVPSNAADNNGFPYVPSVYTSSSQSWSVPYHISLYPLTNNHYDGTGTLLDSNGPPHIESSKSFFTVTMASATAAATATTPAITAGDAVEYMYLSALDMNPTPVYNITSNLAVSHDYVPVTVNSDTGTINFAAPITNASAIATVDPSNTSVAYMYLSDTALFPATPLFNYNVPAGATTYSAAGTQIANAHAVPGSLRVYGPDETPGPNNGVTVLYSPVFSGTPSDNQYNFDYRTNQLLVNANVTTALTISYDYQANLAPLVNSPLNAAPSAATEITADNPAAPMLVKVDYQTRDIIDVNIGVRIYDSGGGGRAELVNQEAQIRIGNSNR